MYTHVVDRVALTICLATCHAMILGSEPALQFSDSEISQFHSAADSGDLVEVRHWLERGMPVDALSRSQFGSRTALCYATSNGRETIVRELIGHGANVLWRDEQTVVHIAAARGYYAIVRMLKEAGADLEAAAGYGGETPLISAASLGYEQTVHELIALGARIDATDEHGQTALSLAAREGRTAIVRILLNKDANPHGSPNKMSALEFASAGAQDGVLKLLLSHKRKPTSAELNEALSLAACYGRLSTVDLLLSAGANVNNTATEMPPLHLAASKGRVAMVSALLARGANVNLAFRANPGASENGTTALHFAAGGGHLLTAISSLSRRKSTSSRREWRVSFRFSHSAR